MDGTDAKRIQAGLRLGGWVEEKGRTRLFSQVFDSAAASEVGPEEGCSWILRRLLSGDMLLRVFFLWWGLSQDEPLSPCCQGAANVAWPGRGLAEARRWKLTGQGDARSL